MECRLVKATRGRCREVHLWLRCSNGKRHVVVEGFKPYFYVPSLFGDRKAIDGETVALVEAECPEDVPKLRENYDKHYEADIPYARRFLIDTGIYSCLEAPPRPSVQLGELEPLDSCNIPLRIWYLDIEVITESGLPSPERPRQPVVAVSIYDSYTDRYTTLFWHPRVQKRITRQGSHVLSTCKLSEKITWRIIGLPSEETLFMELDAILREEQPDIIAGWNISFDYDYLRARAKQLGMELYLSGSSPLDLLEVYKKVGPARRSYALKEVTVEEGYECREEALTAPEAMSGWDRDPRDTIVYNLRDVWRIVRLDKDYRMIEYITALKETVGVEDFSKRDRDGNIRLMGNLPLIDTVLLRIARQRGIVLPTSGKGSRVKYRGAIVLDPVPGIHSGVAVFDMSRYYPSLIISFNISPETKLRPINQSEGIWAFREEPEGLLPAAVKYLLKLREELEEQLSKTEPGTREYTELENKIMAVKGLVNSFYGVTANPHFRLFDPDVASTITGLAREGILFLVKRAKELGYKPLYGDTDSLFIQVPFEEAEDLAKKLTGDLRKYFMEKYGLGREPVLKLKFEKYYSRIFFKPRTKKRYAGLLVWKKGKKIEPPRLDVVGFEAVRTDVPPFTAEAEKRVFEAILGDGDRKMILMLLSELEKRLREMPLSDIALYEGLSKEPSEYKVLQPHVRAALYSNMYLGGNFSAGSKVRYVYVRKVKCKGLPSTDVVAFTPEMERKILECFEVDWPKMYRTVLYEPLSDILEAVGIKARGGLRAHGFF